jgi:hypothetical protein
MTVVRPAEFVVACRVGRLIEGRLSWLNDTADVERFQRVMIETFAQAGPHAVICADWRRALIFSPAVGDAMIELLRRGNREFSRSAVLLSNADATFGLQVERLFREAQNPNRRSFRKVEPMLAWLGEVPTPAERHRASAFLAEASG